MADLTLVIGNKNYSSWSLRPWVLMRHHEIPFDEHQIVLHQPESQARKLEFSGAGRVPVLLHGDLRVWETIAIIEYVAELFPELPLWPADQKARAIARAAAAEMHASFTSLRTHMPMNCRASRPGKGRAPGVQEDIDRVVELWESCRAGYGAGGDFLFGSFTAADAMFAPVVFRLHTYAVELDGVAGDYVQAMLGLPAMQEWLGAGRLESWSIDVYEQPAG